MAGKAIWAEKSNAKLVGLLRKRWSDVVLTTDGEWRLSGTIEGVRFDLVQKTPRGKIYVNGVAASSQSEAIEKVNEALSEVCEGRAGMTELNKRCEDAAEMFLDRRGYEIVERNWTCAAGEADIIARDGDFLVFVEVNARRNCELGLPRECVDEAKRERSERIAALFLRDHDVVDVPIRFDILSIVVVGPDRAMIRHHVNALGEAYGDAA